MKPDAHIFAVCGPTGSGKTALAIALAECTGWDIVSFDARQFYREMDIGTARPTPEELSKATHHFIASHSIFNPLDANTYAKEAFPVVKQNLSEKSGCILVGGSGFYIQTLLYGLDEMPAANPEIRKTLETDWKSGQQNKLLEELAACDPERFAEIDSHNPARVIRALEIWRTTGKKPSSFQTGNKQLKFSATLHWFWPEFERISLRQQLRHRLMQMIERGLESEARSLLEYKELTALQTVGYQEWFSGWSRGQATEDILTQLENHTWQYAKRQITWFKRYHPVSLLLDRNQVRQHIKRMIS